MFYDRIITIINNTEGSLNDLGIWTKGYDIPRRVIQCDVQPYSAQLLYRDYGYNEAVRYRVFCDKDDDIQVGLNVEYEESNYKIIRIVRWDNHMELMLDG